MKEMSFKPALWHSSLHNLQKAIGHTKSDESEEDVGNALLGLLTFDDGLSLALEIPHGTLINRKFEELGNGVRAYAGEYEDINSVFGYSQNGDWYVLKDTYVSNWKESYPGFSTQRIEGNSLIVSNRPVSDNPVVNRIDLELDGFTKWFRNLNITRKYEFKQDGKGDYSGCKKITHEYEPPDSCTLYQDNEMTITVEQIGIEARGPTINPEASLSVTSKLVISYAKPTALEEAKQIAVHQLRELISLLSGAFCSIEAIRAYSLSEKLSIDYYAPFIKREYEITDNEVRHMPFPFPEVEENISEIVERWLNLCPDAVNAAIILVSNLDGSVMSDDLEFVSCASAFEALSRVGVNQERFEQEKFDACMSDALGSIEDEEFREWLEGLVFNRKSAGSLARGLIKKLKPVSSYLVPNTEKFLHDHRICRNAYVHRDGLECDAVLKDEELYFHTQAVWFLCYAAILDLIGIGPEESLEALKESHYQDGVISRVRKQYAK